MTTRRAFGTVLTIALLASILFAPAAAADESDPPDTTTTTTTVPATEDPPAEEPPAEDTDTEANPTDGAEGDEAATDLEEPIVREIVFPVVGPSYFDSSFGDCRDGCTRDHKGNDILTLGWKGAPVVAAHDGRVISTRVGGRLAGCSVTLEDSEGWRTRYVHLNVDIPGTDTEFTACVAPGIEPGARITAGTLLGWVGDSGNAEHTVPHLHFEILDPEGAAIDPYLSLRAAHRIGYAIVGPADLAAIAAASFEPGVTTAYVIGVDDLFELSAGIIDPLAVPLVPYATDDPQPALAALRGLEPERIVFLGDGTPPAYIDDLLALAAIVEYSPIPDPPAPADDDSDDESATEEPSDDAERFEPPVMHDANPSPALLTVVAGTRWSVRSPEGVDGGPLLVLHTERRIRDEWGRNAPSIPALDANRDALWWETVEGWRLTETLDDRPEPTIVLVAGRDVEPWTVSFLTSLASAPPMPLWHHQPTSRTTKSL